MVKYNIISTGSDGNATILEEFVLIDCGVPYKALEPYVPKLKLVLLTHIHSGKTQGLNVLRQERAAERQKVTQMQKSRNNQNNQMIVLIVRILKRTNSRRLQLARPTESRSPTGYGLDAIRCSRLIWPQNSETCGKLV